MSINFPLILVLATALTGTVWLLDYLVFRSKRLNRAAAAGTIEKESREAMLKEPILVEYSISFFPVLAIVLVLRSFLFEPFQIPTGSMIPTLAVGDFILVNKFTYGIRLPVVGTKIVDIAEPKNGEVMVFIPPHQDEYFIKRVVGIPGDKVRYEDKTLYINGKRQIQTFLSQIPPVNPRVLRYREKLGEVDHLIQRNPYRETSVDEWVIPEGHYFMMGDNRDQSSDSRYWGLVSEHNIVGKAVAIWLHKKPGLRLPEFLRNGWIQ
jgi:signal peptidase I